jgi:Cu(I)/Ag(I) efflux system membrane fusion protein
MALVRRKKGTAQALPKGVVARMQLSPYRLQLAGIDTAQVDYRPLAREITAAGFVREAASADGSPAMEVEFRLAERDLPFVSPGDMAEVRLSHAETPPVRGEVVSVDRATEPRSASALARMRLHDVPADWRPGSLATIRLRRPLAEIEPYRSLSRDPPPLRAGEPRTAYISQSHPEVIRHEPGLCPFDKTPLVPVPLAASQRLAWWCPMHPEVTADEDGHACQKCAGMKLLPRIVSYAPPGSVLAVPAGAVIDTGRQQIVFVEVAPGMFEGVRVQLGSRAGDWYPVLAGLTAGQRVATSGAFLLDAETRLSSGPATAYFGAAGSAAGEANSND